MPDTHGYANKSLVDKLGIKAGFNIAVLNAPEHFLDQTLIDLPHGVVINTQLGTSFDLIHFFSTRQHDLLEHFAALKQALKIAGSLWISWPKASSKVLTDLNDNVVRQIGLEHGLVDVKVCAVDKVWSGLKFVYRVKDRPPATE